MIPFEPEPMPRNTKPSPNTIARSTKAHFACTRSRWKNSCSCHSGGRCLRAAATDGAVAGFRAFGPVRRLRCCEPLATLSLRPSGSGSVRRRSSRALGPESRRTRPPQPDPRPDGTGSRRAIRPSGRRAFRRSGTHLGVESQRAGRVDRREARAPPPRPARRRCVPARAPRRPRRGAPRTGRRTDVEAGESVPSPTRTPAARSAVSGATPQPSSAFERGQCATGTSRAARSAISPSSTSTQCAQRSSGQSTGSSACDRPLPGGRNEQRCDLLRAARVPWRSHSVSFALSARCVPTGTPSDRQNRYVSSEQVYGACGEIPIRTSGVSSTSGALLLPLLLRIGSARRRRPPGRRSPAGPARPRPLRRRAREAVVGDRRHARAQRLERAEPSDREHVLGVERALARDVRPDPGAERQPVAEARRSSRTRDACARSRSRGRSRRPSKCRSARPGPTSTIRPSSKRTTPSLDRRPVDRERPSPQIPPTSRADGVRGAAFGAALEQHRGPDRGLVERRAAGPSRSSSSPGRPPAAATPTQQTTK